MVLYHHYCIQELYVSCEGEPVESTMTSLINYSRSTRGKTVVIDSNSYKYCLNTNSPTINYWRCSDRKCLARIQTRKSSGNLIEDALPEHQHSNKLMIQKAKETEKATIDKYSSIPGATTKTVLQEVSTNLLASNSPGLLSSMSSSGAIKMALWRKKQQHNPRPQIPKTHQDFMDIIMPDSYSKTADKGTFLIHKSWVDIMQTKSMALFMSDWGAEVLRKHKIWLMDGTFKTTPAPFAQIYIVMAHSEFGGSGLPCGFCLLPSKEGVVYEEMLFKIKEKVGEARKLEIIITDYESAMFNALLNLFPDVDHFGCIFHFRSTIWTNVGNKGLQSFFHQNMLFQEIIYKIYALSYVPLEEVVRFYEEQIVTEVARGFEQDEEWEEMKEEICAFGNYIAATWIGKQNPRSGGRRRPLFPLESWNQHESILNDGVSTNNCLESFNRTWNSQIGTHPNVWRVIDGFIKQEAEARRVLLSNSTGRDMSENTGRKEKTKSHHFRIKSVVLQFGTLPDRAFLQQIAAELQKK